MKIDKIIEDVLVNISEKRMMSKNICEAEKKKIESLYYKDCHDLLDELLNRIDNRINKV